MKKRYLITGGTGFIGSALVQEWLTQNIDVTVLTRNPEKARQRWNGRVTAIKDLHEAAGEFEVLVNLAGEGIADARWSPERKRLLEQSRIDLTNSLAIWAVETGRRFGAFLSGSAIGYYGSCLPTAQKTCPTHTEASPSGEDYAARLCQRWEEAAGSLSGLCDRTMILRTGVVLGQNGGMLKRLWLPFFLGLGGHLGTGNQVISWIHIEDYIRAVNFLIQTDRKGVFNMCAPIPATNREMCHIFARSINRYSVFPIPSVVLKALLGEMSELLLNGQSVVPANLMASDFDFKFEELQQALADLNR